MRVQGVGEYYSRKNSRHKESEVGEHVAGERRVWVLYGLIREEDLI